MRRLLIQTVALMAAIGCYARVDVGWGADEPRPAAAQEGARRDGAKPDVVKTDDAKEPSIWMKKKLDYSQEILAGLATADFERIDTNAGLMKGLGKVEAFVRGRTPGYRAQFQIFQEATDELARQAAKKNVDGAALAFTQLTISCVNCHKQLRESQAK